MRAGSDVYVCHLPSCPLSVCLLPCVRPPSAISPSTSTHLSLYICIIYYIYISIYKRGTSGKSTGVNRVRNGDQKGLCLVALQQMDSGAAIESFCRCKSVETLSFLWNVEFPPGVSGVLGASPGAPGCPRGPQGVPGDPWVPFS